MTTLREAAQQALEALRGYRREIGCHQSCDAERGLESALAQQEQEPVASAWIHDGVMVNAFPWPPGDPRGCDGDQYWQGKGYAASPLYTYPPRREWQGLNFDQLQSVMSRHFGGCELTDDEADSAEEFARAIEAKLKEKNV